MSRYRSRNHRTGHIALHEGTGGARRLNPRELPVWLAIIVPLPVERAALSAIVVSPSPEVVAPLIRHLERQSARDRIEIVLVTPALPKLPAYEQMFAGFAAWKSVPVGPLVSMSAARAAGVRAASCRFVVFTEEHCFPEPEWGQAILDAFEQHAADAVGPVFLNANPLLAVSWAGLITEYGHWMAPHPGGWMDHLPGHNGAYRRDQLVALGTALETALEGESAFHFEWRAQGRRLWLEPRARVHHVNMTKPWSHLVAAFEFQRPWANSRARNWKWPRRCLYALASPLVPLVRLRRIASEIRRIEVPSGILPRVLPWVMAGLIACALGEFLGYLGSIGGAHHRLLEVELYRRRFLSPRDGGVPAFYSGAYGEC